MDRSHPATRPGVRPVNHSQQSQYSSIPRPWHTSENRAHAVSVNNPAQGAQHTQVDSWRSYKADTANLQSVATPSARLNASAPAFQPTQSATYYKPYESLRTSDGVKERSLIQQAKKSTKNEKSSDGQTGFADRYPVRTNRGQADKPLPSIEITNLDDAIRNNALNKTLRPLQNDKFRRVGSREKTPRQTASPAPPSLTAKYTSQAQQEPKRVTEGRKLLVILDLNGTLLYRVKQHGPKKVHMRPGVTPLLDYLFSNHVVMVYTSATPESARDMVNSFMHPGQRNKLAAIWARDQLDLTLEQYRSKVQVYKKLDKVWQDRGIQASAGPGNRWDQSNTVLIDDSKLKALAQPHNLLQIVEYTRDDDPARIKDRETQRQKHKVQVDILKQLELKLEELRYQVDISRLVRKWQTGEVPVPRLAGQLLSVEEDVDQKKVQQQNEAAKVAAEGRDRTQLPTPDSLTDGDTVERPMEISDHEEDDEGGLILSGTSMSGRESHSPAVTIVSERDRLSKHTDQESVKERQSSESSVDEAVFRELLG